MVSVIMAMSTLGSWVWLHIYTNLEAYSFSSSTLGTIRLKERVCFGSCSGTKEPTVRSPFLQYIKELK
uniref:Uncharacterized protein n=1 Tax=Physcomitrium patens TaxID=3218 RepID=A0A2K1KUE3_PHYPA|nr:hypothetical protein PHYPA_004364 [Physcomitrium patens]